jgi:protein-L-isoaspartate(D-aspartate) O-methyltransferase
VDRVLAVHRLPAPVRLRPGVLYQDLVIARDPARGVNNGSPSLHAKLLEALAPKLGEHVVHVGAGAGYYSAVLAELVGPSGKVTAVEFDAALGERAESLLSGRPNVRVVRGDGAGWPETSADGVYVNFAVSRPADRWIEGLAPGGRLVFPLGAPGPQRPNSGGRHSDRGAATPTRRAQSVRPILFAPKEGSRPIPKSLSDCAPPSTPAASTRSAA